MVNVVIAFVAGFCVSVFVWPWVRTKITGLEGELERLKNDVKAVEAKIKAKL